MHKEGQGHAAGHVLVQLPPENPNCGARLGRPLWIGVGVGHGEGDETVGCAVDIGQGRNCLLPDPKERSVQWFPYIAFRRV